jgi:hypothetical protein
MLTAAEQANNRARLQILSDKETRIGFDAYFHFDWQAKEIMKGLADSSVHLPLVGEWAILSFHELAKEEGMWKRKRGEDFKRAQRTTIDAANLRMSTDNMYARQSNYAPGLEEVNRAFMLVTEQNVIQLQRAQNLLAIAEKTAVFDPRRLGTNWNCVYLQLLKEHISVATGWDNSSVMNAISHLVKAAHQALGRTCSRNVRMLLQKAIRHFEQNPDNATLIRHIKALVLNRDELAKMFPRVALRSPTVV